MFVVTGNRLLDGVVVYLDPKGNWVEDLQLTHCYELDEEAQAALDSQSDDVVSLEVIPVSSKEGVVTPARLREQIRAEGPTVNPFENIDLVRRFDAAAQ